MLFIEMILFVIRTHEFESYQRTKQQHQPQQGGGGSKKSNNGRNHHNPFGYYTSETPKTTMVKN